MQCPVCQTASKKFGKPKGFQRYHYPSCKKSWSERPARQLGEMRLPVERALLVLHLLTEGCAIRAIERITDTEKRTILRLLVQVGEGCERLLPELVKAATVEDVQADEVWGYVRCKEKTKERRKITDPEAGDADCFIGLERHSKLVLAWHLGRRDHWHTQDFMEKLSAATAGRFQLTTDGFSAYPDDVEYNFGSRVDFAQLVKEFGSKGGEEALVLYFVYYNFCKSGTSRRPCPARGGCSSRLAGSAWCRASATSWRCAAPAWSMSPTSSLACVTARDPSRGSSGALCSPSGAADPGAE
ncbi:MAG TPA: hypothetical protein VMW75_09215 [Thermoanaerobaculia bacterium]|nr:hypothetical protein [Thermoanaerobaculia bacterium]